MICITGGAGFLGSALVRRFLKEREKIKVFDIVQPDGEILKDIEFIKGDITDSRSINKGLEGCDIVYHTAGIVPPCKERKKFYQVNVGGTENVLKAAREQKIGKVVFYSTGHSVFGLKSKMPITEESFQVPAFISDYGKSKYQAEILCRRYREQGSNVSIVRPATIIGPGRLGSFKILFDWIKNNKPVFIIGSGQNRIQYLGLDDLLEASWKLKARGHFSDFNLGTDRFGTLRETLEGLIEYAGSKSKIISLPFFLVSAGLDILDFFGLSPFHKMHYKTFHLDFYFDTTKARKELVWQPKQSNVEMLCSAYAQYLGRV